jgi:hypothetical protein
MYGDDRILGQEFPQEVQKQQQELFLETASPIQKYLLEKQLLRQRIFNMNDRDETYQDMNPDGFFECQFTVQGIYYRPDMREELEHIKNDWRIVKTVSQGLMGSNPDYINSMVYMLRDPHAVAKSQERLHRKMLVKGADGELYNLYENMVIHEPKMFINVTVQAMRFILENPDIPFILVNYEDLIADPQTQVKRVFDFIGEPGDLDSGVKQVKPKLNRSDKHEHQDSLLWEDAYLVYDAIKEYGETYNLDVLKTALETIQDPTREINKEQNVYMCYRAKTQTTYKRCQLCRENIIVRNRMREQSEAQDAEAKVADNWRVEPCPFECGMDPHNEPISIEQSIANNFWEHNTPISKLKDKANA